MPRPIGSKGGGPIVGIAFGMGSESGGACPGEGEAEPYRERSAVVSLSAGVPSRDKENCAAKGEEELCESRFQPRLVRHY